MDNKVELGKLGEKLVASLLGATINEDWYDPNGDMVLDLVPIEVKTQNRHPMGFFTVNSKYANQVKKCLTVERLIFVEYDSTKYIKIFECPKAKRSDYKKITTRDGRTMIAWPISDMKLLDTIEDPDLAAEMRSLSNSTSFR